MKFKTRPIKPVEVEAVQWTCFNIDEIIEFVYPEIPEHMSGFSNSGGVFGIVTSNGFKVVQINDWIVKEISTGDIFIYNPEIFKQIFTEG